jgi:hypothetical protein
MSSAVYRLSVADFGGRTHEQFFSTAELAEVERSRVLEQLLSDALPVKRLENGELNRVIHVLASAMVDAFTVIEEASDA